MTNLTSEQFRDILHNVPGHTLETPNVQSLLRRAVEAFYKNFQCYPEIGAAAPGCASVFGEQTQFDGGMTFSLPLPLATVVVGRKVPGYRTTIVTTGDVGKPHKVSFGLSECPLRPRGPTWVDRVKGVMAFYCCNRTVTAFEAAVESSLPMGVGFGSSAALEVALYTFLEVMFGKKIDPVDRAIACQLAEQEFLNITAGIVARLCASTAKDRSAMLIDTSTHNVQWIPFARKEVVFVVIDPHLKDTLYGEEYPERSKLLRKACEILRVDSLRGMTVDDLLTLGDRIRYGMETTTEEATTEDELTERATLLDEDWDEEKLGLVLKRATFYVTEMQRVQEAEEAWNEGDVAAFGEKIVESHNSLKEDFGFSNPVLEFLVDTSLQAEGVLGSKMAGLGLDRGGCVMTLLYRENLEAYSEHVTSSFREHKEELLVQLREVEKKNLQEQIAKGEKRKGKEEKEVPAQESVVVHQGKEHEEEVPLASSGGKYGDEVIVRKKMRKCDPSAKRKMSKKEMREMWKQRASQREEDERKREKQTAEMEAKKNEGVGKEGKLEGKQAVQGGAAEEEDAKEQGTLEDMSQEMEGEAEAEGQDLEDPSMYILSPIAGARMMFTLKSDLLRSRYAKRIPQSKELVRAATVKLQEKFGVKAEAIGLAPATVTLFGEFLEYNMGYLIGLALPLQTVTVGCRQDSSTFTITTTSKEVGDVTEFRAPVPSAGTLDMSFPLNSWIYHAAGTVAEFKGHVPGFVAVVESSVPSEVGLHSCSSFQASIYEFLEGLSRTCSADLFEKADRCRLAEDRMFHLDDPLLSKCSILRFLPTFFCREGYVLLINSKNLKMAHHYLDHPSYVFLIASCKERSSTISLEGLYERLRMCREAAQLLGKDTLVNGDERHIRCLRKRGASEEMIRRARYIITEQERCVKAIRFIAEDDYEGIGMLMTQSHSSLRDDFEVSCPEIELIVNLSLSVDGVLGAKLVGRGLTSSVLILSRLSSVDQCIKHVRKNYTPKRDKPSFYVFKPSCGAYTMNMEDFSLIP